MKQCSKCGLQKDRFYRKSSAKDGLDSWCVDCSNEQSRRYYHKNRETVLSKQLEYYAANKEERQEYAKAYHLRNAEKNKQLMREWKQANPEKVRAARRKNEAKRRAQKLGTVCEDLDPELVFERDSWVCGICESNIDKTLAYPDPNSKSLDHVIPLSKQGTHTYDNVQAAHLLCNVKKSAKIEVGG